MTSKTARSVCVITPTIGHDELKKAVESVAAQTYRRVKHVVVVDGPDYQGNVTNMALPDLMTDAAKSMIVTCAPSNTGGNGFYGHRIYAAYPHLVDEDLIAFLDEDNWYEPNHIESLVEKIERDRFDWAYSLRNVYVDRDKFLAQDCCESIGRWPIFFSTPDNPQHLVDTSAYCFKREFLIQVCQHWHFGWGGDRRFFHIIAKALKHDNYGTTGLHTLNYRLPDMQKAYGGDYDFFKKGNEIIKRTYNGAYPWS